MIFWKTCQIFLKTNGYNLSKKFVQFKIVSHPQYPGLLSFIDMANDLGISIAAHNVKKETLSTFNKPIMAHFVDTHAQTFKIIHKRNIPSLRMIPNWDGIIIKVISENCQCNSYCKAAIKSNQNSIKSKIAFFILVILSFSVLIIKGVFDVRIVIQLCITLIALFICSLILSEQYNLGFISVSSICQKGKYFDCKKVITESGIRILGILSLGDIGFIFFLSNFLFLLILTLVGKQYSIQDALFFLRIIFLTLVPLISILLLYQLLYIKKICILCISLICVVIFQLATLCRLSSGSYGHLNNYFFLWIFCSGLSFIWLPFKEILTELGNYRKSIFESEKIKSDPQLFYALLKIQEKVKFRIWDKEIIIGNPEAKIKILLVINLFCTSCSEYYSTLENAVTDNRYSTCLIVRFLISEDENDLAPYDLIIKAFFSKNRNRDQAIPLWFQLNNQSKYKSFFEIPNNSLDHNNLKNYTDWAENENLSGSPLVFINNHILPNNFPVHYFKKMIPYLLKNIV